MVSPGSFRLHRHGSKSKRFPTRFRWPLDDSRVAPVSELLGPLPAEVDNRDAKGRSANDPEEANSSKTNLIRIPDDVFIKIFGFLKFSDRKNVGLVSKHWLSLESRMRRKLHLDFATCSPVKPWDPHLGFLDHTLEKLLPRMSGLRDITIANMVKPQELSLTDDGLILLGTWCKQLESLTLKITRGISSHGIKTIAICCGSTLRELRLYRCPGVNRDAMKAISDHCVQLRLLSLRACNTLNDEALATLAAGRCRLTLERLEIELCQGVGDRGLQPLPAACPSLQFLDISRCDVTDAGISSLAYDCRKLQHLVARGCDDISNLSLKALAAGNQELKELDVRKCRGISPAGVVALLRGCTGVRRVLVDGTAVDERVRKLAAQNGVQLVAIVGHRFHAPHVMAIGWY